MGIWTDDKEIDVVGLSGHRNSSDGNISPALQLAGMIAAKTRRIETLALGESYFKVCDQGQ